MHSDPLDQIASPRRTAELPLEGALFDLDTIAVAHGITTTYLCVNLEDDAPRLRSDERAREIAHTLVALAPQLRCNYALHVRAEVTLDRTELLRELCDTGFVRLISYMDHSPGQGQFTSIEHFAAYYGARDGATPEELEQKIVAMREGQLSADQRRESIARVAIQTHAVLASHDDDSLATVDRAWELGARIAEFPVNAIAARAAHERGLGVVMGAPNARRGASHLGNLSASEALDGGWLTGLASDYHPQSMLTAAYAWYEQRRCTIEDAVALVSSGPAAMAQLVDRGRIAPGCRADIVAVERRGSYPLVRQTWIAGVAVFGPSTANVKKR